MKLHFTGLEQPLLKELADALASQHEITTDINDLSSDIDRLVVGANTNIEDESVKRAREIGVAVMTIPELLTHLAEDKQRIVISGSKGVRSIISYVVHVLETVGKEVDYVLGEAYGGLGPVKISNAPVIIMEGLGEVTSFDNSKPQFLGLNHHIVLITSLSHDFEDRYPSFDKYVREFDRLADGTPKSGTIIYCEDDDLVTVIGGKERNDVRTVAYSAHPGSSSSSKTVLNTGDGSVEVNVSGDNALSDIGAAKALLSRFSVTDDQFYSAIKSYDPS